MGTRPPWTTGRHFAAKAARSTGEPRGALPPRLLAAVASGLAAAAAFPPFGVWPLAIVAVAVFALLLRNQGWRRGALLGGVHGLAFFLPLLHWSGVYVGVLPWVLLALSQAAFFALYGALAPTLWRLPGAPFFLAALWVAVEAARSRVPFGGFPWGRLAFSSADSTLAPLAALGGAPLVSFAAALCGTLLAAAAGRHVLRPPRAAGGGPRGRGTLALVAGAVVLVLLGLLVPTPGGSAKTAVVAVVQGNVPRAGLEFNAERERVLRNHVAATESLAERVRTGKVQKPDLVLWPENASDIDPFTDPSAAALIQSAADQIGVPVLVGAVVDGPGRYLSNTGVVWRPGTGPGERYVKRHPAPFGEYIPLRSLARKVSAKVDLVSRDFVAGTDVRTLPMGKARVADVICFEVAYDGLVRDVVRKGGNLLVVQTNNATFGRTGEAVQQLAMTRLRAIEHGRATVQASTVGVSAIVRPDGSIVSKTALFTRDVLVARVPLRDAVTVADRVGSWPELALVLATVLGLLVAARRGRA
ncbi:MAG: apolipoprotein N-acyltransferase [Actinomycetes bacterium]